MTMQVIQHIELGSAAANITFSSIPQTYTDLMLVVSDRSDRSAGGINDAVVLQLNGASSTGRRLRGSGSGVVSDTSVGLINPAAGTTSNTYSNCTFYIPNYASTTTNKSWSGDGVMENNGTTSFQSIVAGLYASNSAVTSITLVQEVGPNFVAGSSATLYGITKGLDGTTTVS